MLGTQAFLLLATSACLSQGGLRLWINKSPNLVAPTRRLTTSFGDNLVNTDAFVKTVTRFKTTSNKLEASEKKSPSAAAGLAYLKTFSLDGLCGLPAQVYLENILNGKSTAEATAAATRVYIEGYNNGERLPEGGACRKADLAYRSAFITGEDPILAAARAYMDSWPGVQQGNPCGVAGVEYVKAIINGKSDLEASTISSRRFSEAFKELAKTGRSLDDPACAAASKAYFDAIPNKPANLHAAAFTSFINKVFDEDSPAPVLDPACLTSFDAFLDAFNAGEDFLTSNLIAARAFFKEISSGALINPDSACTAATKSYTEEIYDNPSPPSTAAMLAYINQAIATGNRRIDPVCAASAEAYFDEYIEKKDESAAAEAAAVAYLNALEENPNFDTESPCGKAAQAYIDEFEVE